MDITRSMAGTSSTPSQDDSAGLSVPSVSLAPLRDQRTPPEQMIGNLIIDEAPREPWKPRERDPPHLQDVVTQQTEMLAKMLAELWARHAQLAAPAANLADPPADPNFNWAKLVQPAETNFQVPGDGQV